VIAGDSKACFKLGTPIDTAPGTYYIQVNKNEDFNGTTVLYLNPGYMQINIKTGS